MTSRDFLAAALRRWYVVVLGAVLTLAAFALVQRQAPVFFTQFNIVLVGPSGTEVDSIAPITPVETIQLHIMARTKSVSMPAAPYFS